MFRLRKACRFSVGNQINQPKCSDQLVQLWTCRITSTSHLSASMTMNLINDEKKIREDHRYKWLKGNFYIACLDLLSKQCLDILEIQTFPLFCSVLNQKINIRCHSQKPVCLAENLEIEEKHLPILVVYSLRSCFNCQISSPAHNFMSVRWLISMFALTLNLRSRKEWQKGA